MTLKSKPEFIPMTGSPSCRLELSMLSVVTADGKPMLTEDGFAVVVYIDGMNRYKFYALAGGWFWPTYPKTRADFLR